MALPEHHRDADPMVGSTGTSIADTSADAIAAQFANALAEIRLQLTAAMPDHVSAAPPAIAVAFSGGLDSTVLLHLACAYAAAHGIVLHALHVHHGLSPLADAWLAHCRDRAMHHEVRFDIRRIVVAGQAGAGIEGAARIGRYAALGEMCRAHAVPLLLTAHHQDDQAETVLLQLLRGCGVAGLGAMQTHNRAPGLLGDANTCIGRPLLGLPRSALQAYAAARGIVNIEDPSNMDARHARNALRLQVMPVLQSRFPGFAARLARTAGHAQAAQQLLVELAQQDLATCAVDGDIDLQRLREFSAARSDNLLRYWFGSHGLRMPSTAWLHEMRSQVFDAKADARILLGHPDCTIHRYRNRILMRARQPLPDPLHDLEDDRIDFSWDGSACMVFQTFAGRLHFEAAEPGVAAAWLAQQVLTLRWRSGGWRLKLAPNRSTRSLKYHYQAAGVPAWDRTRLPLVTLQQQLLYAAGIGMDCQHFSTAIGPHIALRWQADGG